MIRSTNGSTAKRSTRELFCPNCGSSLVEPGSFVNEYWMSAETVYFCWCADCGFRCEISEVTRVTATQPSED